ncbi:MAG: chemotaxis protein CheX [Gammaproteobacteria bacterium]|nr:chemotaxis protein CheX [Gammaproteobacteria bacterium]
MDAADLQAIVDGAKAFFTQNTCVEPEVGTPFLEDSGGRPGGEVTGVTGVIGISGPQRGWVCFSAPQALLRHVLILLGERDTGPANTRDLAGEIANTIAGNARRHFGRNFLISVPCVFAGTFEGVQRGPKPRAVVIPLRWRIFTASIVVNLAEDSIRPY